MNALLILAVLITSARVELTTFAVKTPEDPHWRWTANRQLFSLHLVHDKPHAQLSAAWTPLLQSYKAGDPGATMEQYIRRRVADLFEDSPDTRVLRIEKTGDETINGLPYQHWELRLTHSDLKHTTIEYRLTVLARSASGTPDIFLFTLMTPEPEAARHPEFQQTLRELVDNTHYEQYAFADVALGRVAIAGHQYFQAAERDSKDRDTNKISSAKNDLVVELNYARAVLTNSPQPWVVYGRLAEYSANDLRYGEGFNAGQAETCYRKALALDSGYVPAIEGLAKLFEATNRPADAERAWKDAIETAPSNADCHYKLGRLYQRQHRSQEALVEFRQALRFWHGAPVTKKELEKEVAELSKR